MASFKLTSIQEVVVSATGMDAAGNPAPIESFKVTSSDESIATVTQKDDGSFVIAATGKTGFTQIDATADALIGEGEKPLQAEPVTLEVVAAEAVTFTLNFGEPSQKV